jgi:subtilisin family serine protease
MVRTPSRPVYASFAVSIWLVGAAVASADQRVIVKTKKPYDAVKQQITALGGSVTYEFANADGLAVTVPDAQLNALKGIAGVDYVVEDRLVPNPAPEGRRDVAEALLAAPALDAEPASYFPHASVLTNARTLQLAGILGQGVVVGLIDSGTSRTASALCTNATSAATCIATSRVIGGENFVPGATEPDANSSLNGPHGTWVATTIGGNRAFGFLRTSALATAVRNNCPQPNCSFQASATVDAIPIVGQAPAAQFYALKVFAAAGGGAPESRILQAMDRAIELKNTTLPNMKVVNMSLGGPTVFAGHDLADELATSMAASGITLVVSAGNEGPSGITGGSPGTARNILTVGAASDPIHERIVAEVFFFPGVPGVVFRPDGSQQMADFSSRGPTADGREDPEVVANGVWTFAQGANGGLSFVSGTSFSAPTVSGIAALLYSHTPAATPSQVRSAIVGSASATRIPTATVLDQGAGYVDAAAADALLQTAPAPITDIGPEKKKLTQNISQGVGIQPIDSSSFSTHLANLRPSERREFFYEVKKDTAAVHVTFSNIVAELPPAQQNQLFGDDLQVAIHSAQTSSTDDYVVPPNQFINANKTYVLERPQTGLIRVTALGDWTNAGRVSADVTIEEVIAPLPKWEFKDKIAEGEQRLYTVTIPPGTPEVTFRMSWKDDWGAYPTNDLDMYLFGPGGVTNFTGATLNSPETVTIQNPAAGTWTIVVDGFSVFGKDDQYEIRVEY